MSRRSAVDKYEDRRKKLLQAESKLFEENSSGIFETVVVLPRTYGRAIENLAFQRLYEQLSTWPDTVCARAFMPEKDEYNWRKRQKRPVVAFETGKPIRDCDLLVFLLPSERDWLEALKIMKLSGLDLESNERGHKWPIIMATGLSVTANPIPLSSFFDAFVIGETEPTLGPLLDVIKSLGSRRRPKAEILSTLSSLPGLYVPSTHGVVPKHSIMRQWAGADGIGSMTNIVSPFAEVPDTYILEVARGCPFNCRFCMEGYLLLPYRESRPDDMEERISSIPEKALLVYAMYTAEGLEELHTFEEMAKARGISVRVNSHMKESPELEAELKTILDEKVLVLLPETGSESLRRVIGKFRTDDYYFEQVRSMPSSIEEIHIQIQLGLPFENDSDRLANVEFIKTISDMVNVTVSVRINQFLPRPWTAFQWSPMVTAKNMYSYLKTLKEQLSKLGITNVRHMDPREVQIDALLIGGDHRVGIALKKRLEGVSWSAAFSAAGIDTSSVFRQKDHARKLTWAFLNMGFGYTRLAREYQAALAAEESRENSNEQPTG